MNFDYRKILTKKRTITVYVSVFVLFALYLSGCVNYDQKTTLKADGSDQ